VTCNDCEVLRRCSKNKISKNYLKINRISVLEIMLAQNKIVKFR